MLENVLKNQSFKVKITIKSIISVGLVLATAFLPLVIHANFGTVGGATYLPMYLPVLIGGCLLGSIFGTAVGAISPIASYFISQAVIGTCMPIAIKLPFMIMELAVFGLVAGLFSKKIINKPIIAFPAVISAQVVGRGFYLIISLITGQFVSTFASIQKGFLGLAIQVILVPIIIIALAKMMQNDKA